MPDISKHMTIHLEGKNKINKFQSVPTPFFFFYRQLMFAKVLSPWLLQKSSAHSPMFAKQKNRRRPEVQNYLLWRSANSKLWIKGSRKTPINEKSHTKDLQFDHGLVNYAGGSWRNLPADTANSKLLGNLLKHWITISTQFSLLKMVNALLLLSLRWKYRIVEKDHIVTAETTNSIQ